MRRAVFVDSQNPHLARMALFAKRKLYPMEELLYYHPAATAAAAAAAAAAAVAAAAAK